MTTIKPHARLTGQELERLTKKVVAAYKKGDSIRSIAEANNRSYGSIHRIVTQSADITVRPRGGATRGKAANGKARAK